MTNGIGVDATIIAGGTAEVLTQAYDMTRYGIGTISNINYFGGTGYLPLPIFQVEEVVRKNIAHGIGKGGRARIERSCP